jgi:hypothetical protein
MLNTATKHVIQTAKASNQMYHFFIRSLDLLIGIFVIFGMLAVLFAGFAVADGRWMAPNEMPMANGRFAGALVVLVGTLNVFFVAGFLYLGVGIYYNTKRTADAVEKMVKKAPTSYKELTGRKDPVIRKEPTI